jgi:tripartite-type tricarboxylate transporter receptor subunit TctC
VVRAAPDGYTLLLSTSAMNAAVILHKSLPYDTVRDLEPVAMFGGEPSMLAVSPKGYSSVGDLVAAAKANPGKLKFASVGIGSASYLAGERFRLVAGLNVQHVAYPEPTDALNDLMAGRVDYYFTPIAPTVPLAAQGRVLPLAVSTASRWPSLPNLPTLAETGFPISTFLVWCGLSAPAKTPDNIVAKLNDAINDVLDLPAIQFRLQVMGFKPVQMSAAQYGEFVADDLASMIQLGKDANITPTE